ncbi:NADH:flavin oxidoreductase [Natronomonas sp. EA1]|uniref:oxidoreductase n=1 Tax=Natronomonas sp. EA1 TaxID=3421655 RepID=UPI003EBC2192
MSQDVLFEEFDLGDLTLDNRVGLAPMTRTSGTDDGLATAEMARYYAKFAEGGFSFLVTEGVFPNANPGKGYDGQPGLATDEQAASWEQVTSAVHDADSAIVAQLMHAGPITQADGVEAVGPSETTPQGEQLPIYGGEGEFPEASALSTDDLEAVKAQFVASAKRAVDAGFDGVEIHGANGYLLYSFLKSTQNTREDEYGGSPEARARFPREVLDAVIEATPDEFVVGIRLSQTAVQDDEHRWTAEEAEAYLSALDAGDYVHVTQEPITEPAFEDTEQTLYELAEAYADTAVIANGGIGSPEAAAEVIENGADLVTQAKSALANPDWPARVQAGEALDDFDFEETLLPTAELKEFEVPAPARSADD